MKKLHIAAIFILAFGIFIKADAMTLPFQNNTEREIKKVLNEHSKAMDNRDIEKLKTFYDENYRSEDGFDINDLVEMIQKTYNAYGNIKYKTSINHISAYDNWALVQISDKSYAKIFLEDNKNKDKMGVLKGTSVYNLYLKKDRNDKWKIYRDDIVMEETSLKYGIANQIDMDLVTPVMVKKDESYDISLKMDKPDDIIALGSISREEITYPPKDYPEKFRKIPQEGELERVVRANGKGLDEYAIASIGFTKISMNEEQTKARIHILGMAYILKRINVDKLGIIKANER